MLGVKRLFLVWVAHFSTTHTQFSLWFLKFTQNIWLVNTFFLPQNPANNIEWKVFTPPPPIRHTLSRLKCDGQIIMNLYFQKSIRFFACYCYTATHVFPHGVISIHSLQRVTLSIVRKKILVEYQQYYKRGDS